MKTLQALLSNPNTLIVLGICVSYGCMLLIDRKFRDAPDDYEP